MAKTNQEILKQVRDNASAEYQARIPEAKSATGAEILTALGDYPSSKNEFIQALTNKVVKTVFYSKVFNNPLRMLHRGNLPYGYSIENIFVEMASKKGMRQNFDGSTTPEGDLIRKQEAKVIVKYAEKNFEYKYKVSISEAQLRTAFLNPDGLSNMISQLVSSEISAAYFDEYEDMKGLLFDAAGAKRRVLSSTGLPQETALTSADAKNPLKTVSCEAGNPRALAETVRSLAGRLQFPSTAYNMAGANTWSNSEDLIFITTPETQANLDVNVLAQAFNVSSAEVKVRTIIVDELPSQFADSIGGGTSSKNCLGILADKDFIQAYDTLFETRTFENADQLMTNMFLHKHGIMTNAYFANAVAIIAE